MREFCRILQKGPRRRGVHSLRAELSALGTSYVSFPDLALHSGWEEPKALCLCLDYSRLLFSSPCCLMHLLSCAGLDEAWRTRAVPEAHICTYTTAKTRAHWGNCSAAPTPRAPDKQGSHADAGLRGG